MITQMSLFEINEQNELVVSCKGTGEGYFTFTPPPQYKPSEAMPKLSYTQWISRVQAAAARGDLNAELADKILNSLKRLPDLKRGQKACVSFSIGKDSEAVFLLAAMRYEPHEIMSLFADTHDEWPESYSFLPVFEKWIGIPVVTINTIGIHRLLRERIPVWPKMGTRHCTKNLKMLPQRDYLDENGFDQVRHAGPAKFRPTYGQEHLSREERAAFLKEKPKAQLIEVLQPAPIMLSGERWAESEGRSKLPLEEKDGTIMRVSHRPVLDFRIEEIWEFIFWMRAPYNPVYHFVKRCACAGCPFASKSELVTLGQYHPERLQEWVITEKAIGHPWKKVGLSVIQDEINQQRKKEAQAS